LKGLCREKKANGKRIKGVRLGGTYVKKGHHRKERLKTTDRVKTYEKIPQMNIPKIKTTMLKVG